MNIENFTMQSTRQHYCITMFEHYTFLIWSKIRSSYMFNSNFPHHTYVDFLCPFNSKNCRPKWNLKKNGRPDRRKTISNFIERNQSHFDHHWRRNCCTIEPKQKSDAHMVETREKSGKHFTQCNFSIAHKIICFNSIWV